MGRKKKVQQNGGSFSALNNLDINTYWSIVQVVIDEVCGNNVGQGLAFTTHEVLFARYGLLVTSILGGFCWSGAYRVICSQTFQDIAYRYEDSQGEARYLQTFRNGIQYRITPHPIVILALNQLVMNLISSGSVGKNSFTVRLATALGPNAGRGKDGTVTSTDFDYRVGVTTAYLQLIAHRLNARRLPTLDDFLSLSSHLAWFVYDMDVRAALLGEIKTGTVQIDLSSDDLLRRVRQPLIERGEEK